MKSKVSSFLHSPDAVPRAWLALAIIGVCLTGLFAIEITFARIPWFAEWFSADTFYRALCVHVVFAMLVWLVLFAVFMWHLNAPQLKKSTDGPALALAMGGIVLIAITGFIHIGTPYLNDYLPVIHHPVFWLGVAAFMGSFVLSIAKFLPSAAGLYRKNTEGSLVFFSIAIAVVMLVAVVFSIATTDTAADHKLYFQRLFWVPGHIQQFMNASLLMLAWHFLARRSGMSSDGFADNVWTRLANWLLFLAIFPMFGGYFVDPVLPAFKLATVVSYGVGLGIPVLIHTIFLVRKVRLKSYAGSTLALSASLYYVGVFIAYFGMASDLRVTAHYHGVVTALTVALMGITYVTLTDWKILRYRKLASIQPAVFTAGMMVLILCLFFAGHYGAPRKTFGFSWVVDNAVISYLNVLAVGATLSIVGGLMYVYYCVASLLNRSMKLGASTAVLLIVLLANTGFRMPREADFLGRSVADVPLMLSDGSSPMLSTLRGGVPTILSPVYTDCPSFCSAITANLKASLDELGSRAGEYNVVSVSFDTTDKTFNLSNFAKRWKLDTERWSVATGRGQDMLDLLRSIDFEYEWNAKTREFEHPNVVIVLTPSGKISRYLYGIKPNSSDLKLAILEARAEQSGLGLYDGFIVRCFVYDPVTGSYVADRKFILMIVSGGISVGGMLGYLGWQAFSSIRKKYTPQVNA